ncbi:MAG: hypothetical protein JW720_13485 [Sedimentisphaerales bacterium]|nr:hypothetical protein [Sedimentisphaerales bacterium]
MSKMVSNILFTKNRPLQLHGYLESLRRHLPGELIQTYIIYKPDLFGREYERLFDEYPDCIVVREQDFHSDFLGVLDHVETKYILFGIDDVVYFDSVNFDVIDKTFAEHEKDIFGFTMRFGVEYLNCGGDEVERLDVAGGSVHRVNWKMGQTPHSRYPFELCSTFYTTRLVKKIINAAMSNNPLARRLFSPGSRLMGGLGRLGSTRSILKRFGYFFNPNTLESWNCRWCRNHRNEMPDYIYFQKLCAGAVQVNMVNTTTANTFDGTAEQTVEALNEKYRQGYRLDIDFIAANKPAEPSCGRQHFRLVKK